MHCGIAAMRGSGDSIGAPLAAILDEKLNENPPGDGDGDGGGGGGGAGLGGRGPVCEAAGPSMQG